MNPDTSLTAVRAALDAYVDPYLQETLGSAGAIRELHAAGGGFSVELALGFPVGGYQADLGRALSTHLAAAGITAPLTLDLHADIRAHAVQRNLKPLGDIRNIVAVASGKGGVGKSTVAANLALAWTLQGAISKSDLSFAQRRKSPLAPDEVNIVQEPFAIVHVDNLAPFDAESIMGTEHAALKRRDALIASNPALRNALQVVPTFEMAA